MAEVAVRFPEQAEEPLVVAAKTGDHEAFRRLTEPYSRELHLHCYRMVGSLADAEDLVQETMLRAWHSLGTFEGRARFRSWLYTIATNACLKQLQRHPSRVLPRDFGPPADPTLPPSPPIAEIVYVDPYPDALLEGLDRTSNDPEALYLLQESIELAFITAIQLLTPRQRAVLILHDVLRWRAHEVAALLGSSVASVNGALRRARAVLAGQVHSHRGSADGTAHRAAERAVLKRYMSAWEAGDMNALATLLKEDALLTMPPALTWFEGPGAIAAFFHALCFSEEPKRFQMLPTRANGQPACAAYEWDAATGASRFSGIMVLRIEDELVTEVTGFGDPSLASWFGLPALLRSETASQPL